MTAPEGYVAEITERPIDRAALETFVLSASDEYSVQPEAERFLAEVCRSVAASSGLSWRQRTASAPSPRRTAAARLPARRARVNGRG